MLAYPRRFWAKPPAVCGPGNWPDGPQNTPGGKGQTAGAKLFSPGGKSQTAGGNLRTHQPGQPHTHPIPLPLSDPNPCCRQPKSLAAAPHGAPPLASAAHQCRSPPPTSRRPEPDTRQRALVTSVTRVGWMWPRAPRPRLPTPRGRLGAGMDGLAGGVASEIPRWTNRPVLASRSPDLAASLSFPHPTYSLPVSLSQFHSPCSRRHEGGSQAWTGDERLSCDLRLIPDLDARGSWSPGPQRRRSLVACSAAVLPKVLPTHASSMDTFSVRVLLTSICCCAICSWRCRC